MFKQLRSLAKDSLVYGLSGMVSRFLSLFLVPLYTRLFTPEDYGVMSLIATTLALVGAFTSLGLENAVHRWYWDTDNIMERKSTMATWIWTMLPLSSLFAVIVIGSRSWLAEIIIGRADAARYFALASLTLPLGVLGIVVVNWFRLQRRPWATVSVSLGTSLFFILSAFVLVLVLRWGLTGVYVAQVATAVLGTTVAIVLMKDWVHPTWFDWSRLKSMLRFSLPMVPAGLSLWVVNACGSYFIQFFSSTAEVGLYAIGSSLASAIALLTGAFQLAWGPFALSIHKQDYAKQVYASAFLGYLWLTCVLSTGLTLFAPEILNILTTESYIDAYSVVGPLSFSYVMTGLTYIAAIGPAIVKNSKPTGFAIAVAAAITILLNFALVPVFGKEGAAIATLIGQSTVPIYLFYRSQQLFPIPYRFVLGASLVVLSWLLIFIGQSWHPDSLLGSVVLKLALLISFVPLFFSLRLSNE